ncbi:hypothetical protein SALBM217S_03180 [Streptomyces griseoloalbus]
MGHRIDASGQSCAAGIRHTGRKGVSRMGAL